MFLRNINHWQVQTFYVMNLPIENPIHYAIEDK
jgi:hypothetical protein